VAHIEISKLCTKSRDPVVLYVSGGNTQSSIIYGTATDDRAIQQYYEMGYTVGEKQARNEATEKKPQIDNPLLNKAYQRGFREGWDSQQPQKTLEE
jgi:hypothetical protein